MTCDQHWGLLSWTLRTDAGWGCALWERSGVSKAL